MFNSYNNFQISNIKIFFKHHFNLCNLQWTNIKFKYKIHCIIFKINKLRDVFKQQINNKNFYKELIRKINWER